MQHDILFMVHQAIGSLSKLKFKIKMLHRRSCVLFVVNRQYYYILVELQMVVFAPSLRLKSVENL